MTLSRYLMCHSIGTGKTMAMIELVKKMKGTLIVRNEEEARRLRERYDIQAFAYSVDANKLLGLHMGPTFVDPDAVGTWVMGLEERVGKLEANFKEMAIKILEGKNAVALELALEHLGNHKISRS